MKRILTCFVLTVCFCSAAFPQEDAKTAKAKAALQKAADTNGRELATQINVSNNVHAQAVLIPPVDARRIFGKEIAEHYAVIEVNVGNKSSDAALIIQGVFIDYSHWALRGGGGLNLGEFHPAGDPFQASTKKDQVASEEYRVVRSQLLDAKMWSKRNWTMRLLTLAGNLAGAYPFPIASKSFQKELTTFAGVFVPGVNEVWPDGMIQQLNNVSDFGFQSNKVISKQGSDIIVCFFPIERFLTPGFRKLYLKSPAIFFAPLQTLPDKEGLSDLRKYINLGIPEDQFKTMAAALPCYMGLSIWQTTNEKPPDFKQCLDTYGLEVDKDAKPKDEDKNEAKDEDKNKSKDKDKNKEKDNEPVKTNLRIKNETGAEDKALPFRRLDFINHVSLNSVIVTIDGVMSVDTTAIAGKIDILEFDELAKCGDDKEPCFWAAPDVGNGVRTGVIHGSYLTGGSLAIAEANDLGITVTTVSENASDQVIHFSLKLTKPVPRKIEGEPTILHFTIKKPKPGSTSEKPQSLDSLAFEYPVGYPNPSVRVKTPQILTPKDGKLTIEGNFIHDPSDSLVVMLHSPTGDDIEGKLADSSTSKQLVVTNLADAKDAGCWIVTVDIGGVSYPPEGPACLCFFVNPSPKLESAERNKDKMEIAVVGSDLIDTSRCGGPRLSFKVVSDAGTTKPVNPNPKRPDEKLILILPDAAKTGSWTLKVFLNADEAASVKLTDPPSP